MGGKMTVEEADELTKFADGGDGHIDINEFATNLCPPKK